LHIGSISIPVWKGGGHLYGEETEFSFAVEEYVSSVTKGYILLDNSFSVRPIRGRVKNPG